MQEIMIIGGIVLGGLGLLPVIVSLFLRDVEAGTIRLVSWLQGTTVIYRGPGKSKEIPLLMIKTAANRFFAKPESDQISTRTDLLSSSGRRAINLLTHAQLFSARTVPRTPRPTLPAVPDGRGAAESVVGNISSVIQSVLAAQLVTRNGLLGETDDGQKM